MLKEEDTPASPNGSEHEICLHPQEIEFVGAFRRQLWAMIVAVLLTTVTSAGGMVGLGSCVGTTQAEVAHLRERNDERVRENTELRQQLRELERNNAQAHQEILESVRRMEGRLEQLIADQQGEGH